MVKLEDLKKSEMSESFNKILAEIREITSDEEKQSKLLTARILKDFIEHSQNLKKKNSGFLQPKKPSCSRTKLIQKPRKRSHSETEVVEQEDHKANTSSALQLPLKKRLYPRAAVVTKEKTKTASVGFGYNTSEGVVDGDEKSNRKHGREWKMRRTSSYVIRRGWSKACEKPENKLIAGGKVQVWSFRVHGELRFAIVRVEDTAEPHSSSSCSSSISSLGVEGNYVHDN